MIFAKRMVLGDAGGICYSRRADDQREQNGK